MKLIIFIILSIAALAVLFSKLLGKSSSVDEPMNVNRDQDNFWRRLDDHEKMLGE